MIERKPIPEQAPRATPDPHEETKPKPVESFNWRRKERGQRDNMCRPCRAAYHREHYLANKAQYVASAAESKRRLRLARTHWLLEYFKAARKRLKADGIFVLDVLGGTDSMGADVNSHHLGDFVYVWEQAHFDPLTHEFLAHIHFEFPDGSRVTKAYTYDWRLWTMPELCDVLRDAGFSATHPLWEKTDARGEGLGLFYEPKRVENQQSWWTYLVAER